MAKNLFKTLRQKKHSKLPEFQRYYCCTSYLHVCPCKIVILVYVIHTFTYGKTHVGEWPQDLVMFEYSNLAIDNAEI